MYYHGRGLAKYKSKMYKEAIDDFDKAIDLNPEFIESYYSRSFPKMALKQYDSALRILIK